MTLTELNEKWIKDSEVPALLGVSKRTWAGIRKKDKVPYSKRGYAKFIAIEDISAWIEKNKTQNTPGND